jgi:hypothetical protein
MRKSEHTFSYRTEGIKRTWLVPRIWDACKGKKSLWISLDKFDTLKNLAWGGGLTYGDFLAHLKRCYDANLGNPIIVLNDESLQDSCIVDGQHRLMKAYQFLDDVKCVFITWEELLAIDHEEEPDEIEEGISNDVFCWGGANADAICKKIKLHSGFDVEWSFSTEYDDEIEIFYNTILIYTIVRDVVYRFDLDGWDAGFPAIQEF